jgi:uncharacterized protein YkwD/uncharacterized membrane protein required for colicin V production
MIIDIIIALILLFGLYSGYRQGFVAGFLQIVGVMGIIVLSWEIYPIINPYLNKYLHLILIVSSFAAFILVFIILAIIWNALFNLLINLFPSSFRKNIFNRILGIIPGLIYVFLYISVVCWFLINYPIIAIQPYVDASKLIRPVAQVWDKPFLGSTTKIDSVIRGLGSSSANPNGNEPLKKIALPFTRLSVDTNSEQQMLTLLNDYRTQNGLSPLVMSKDLQTIARSQATDMWSRQFFSHVNPDGLTPFDRLNNANVPYIEAGENLALAPNVVIANKNLIASPEHRENILYKGFHKVGIGVIDSGNSNGKIFVEEFTN